MIAVASDVVAVALFVVGFASSVAAGKTRYPPNLLSGLSIAATCTG